MNIIISPWSKKLRNGGENPKNYPYWEEVIKLLKEDGHTITQIGIKEEKCFDVDLAFDKTLDELTEMIKKCDVWISVDNFLQHLCHLVGKPGIVIFSKSDPKIFGYEENINLLKDRKYLRERQFDIWENEKYEKECFVEPNIVIDAVKAFGGNR